LTPADDVPRRHLGLIDAAALYAGIILGSGIFVAPAAVAGATASLTSALFLWLGGAVIAACGACCYAECASRKPSNGGFFVFQQEAYGPALAFVGGWAAIFVTYPASIAAIAMVLASYFAEAAGFAGREAPVAIGALAAAAVLNLAGLRTGPRAQLALTSVKLAALVLLALAAWGSPASPVPAAPSTTVPPPGLSTWLPALMLLLWTYEGWSDVTLVAGEVRSPGRSLGLAVILGTAALFAVYALVQVAVHRVLGPAAAASTRPVADVVAAVGGPAAGRALAALVVVSTFGSIVGVVFTVSRLAQAMARNGAFLRTFATIHPRLGTPVAAISAMTAMSIVYVLAGSFRGILVYFTFSIWIFYGLTAVALLILRKRRVGEDVAWRAPLGVLPPLVVLLVGTVMTSQLIAAEPGHAAAGIGMLASGFAAYALFVRFKDVPA
jgi:APA family basic amino acid/polyamine antiporter